jgi:hypothetical protein
MARIRNNMIHPRIFDALCAHPYGLKMQELIPHVYPDPDREPDWAANCITASVCRMNKRWRAEKSMLRVRGSGGPGSRYQIWIARP